MNRVGLLKSNEGKEGLSMVSKVLVIADATTEAVELILGALKTIHGDQLRVEALFISRLSGVLLKKIGSNILTLLMREEEKAVQRAREYFTTEGIPYDIKITPSLPWQEVLNEVELKTHDITILQGEFADIWGKDHPPSYGLGAITESANPVRILKGSGESSAAPIRP